MEIWKDIKGYENYYQVSNYGRVRSLDKIINCLGAKNIKQHIRYGRILKQNITTTGYYYVNLSKEGKIKNLRVHRLVAETFLHNYKNILE